MKNLTLPQCYLHPITLSNLGRSYWSSIPNTATSGTSPSPAPTCTCFPFIMADERNHLTSHSHKAVKGNEGRQTALSWYWIHCKGHVKDQLAASSPYWEVLPINSHFPVLLSLLFRLNSRLCLNPEDDYYYCYYFIWDRQTYTNKQTTSPNEENRCGDPGNLTRHWIWK